MTKPRWSTDDTLRRARIGNRIGVKYQAVLGPRLPAGFLEQLQVDRAFLGDPEAQDATKLRAQKITTAAEREASKKGYAFVMSVREIAKRDKSASQELRTALGIGDGLRENDTGNVALALRGIIEQATALAALGVLPEDIAEATELRTNLLAADTAQDERRDEREASTEARVEAHLRIEAAIDMLSSRGAFAFRHDPLVQALFQRLVAVSGPSAQDEKDAGGEPSPVDPVTP